MYIREVKNPKRTICFYIAVFVLVILFSTEVSFSKDDTIQGFVTKVTDGDTVSISGNGNYTCRLYGIDAPEKSQEYGQAATSHLSSLILNKHVNIELTGDVTYGRQICRIKKDGEDINLKMVKEGYAWAYKQYLKRPHASEYIEAENSARKAQRGLWRNINPTPPWEFRQRR